MTPPSTLGAAGPSHFGRWKNSHLPRFWPAACRPQRHIFFTSCPYGGLTPPLCQQHPCQSLGAAGLSHFVSGRQHSDNFCSGIRPFGGLTPPLHSLTSSSAALLTDCNVHAAKTYGIMAQPSMSLRKNNSARVVFFC